jgi:hypothetical protein
MSLFPILLGKILPYFIINQIQVIIMILIEFILSLCWRLFSNKWQLLTYILHE